MMLSSVETGKTVHVLAVNSGQGLQSRLAGMGIVPGVDLTVVDNIPGRPLLVSLDGSRLAIGQGMAEKIRVSARTAPVTESGDTPAHCEGEKKMNRRVCLRQMNVNQTGRILSVKAQGELGRRIRDMGLIPNTEVKVVGRAPLKDPVALRLRDFTISLRNNEADYIMVEIQGG